MPLKSQVKFCPVCKKETKHAVPVLGFPWICTHKHSDDSQICARCGKELSTQGRGAVANIGRQRKLICSECVDIIFKR